MPLDKMNIPVWCSLRGNKINVVDRQKATHVLAHVSTVNRSGTTGFDAHMIGKESVNCIAIPCEDIWLYYVNTNMPAVIIPHIVRRTMSAMYSLVDMYDFSDFTGDRFLQIGRAHV